MDEINQVRLSVAVNAIAAIIVGALSVYLTAISRSLFAGIAGIVILAVLTFAMNKAVKGKDKKWWASNGIIIFLLVWLVSWTVFKNIGL